MHVNQHLSDILMTIWHMGINHIALRMAKTLSAIGLKMLSSDGKGPVLEKKKFYKYFMTMMIFALQYIVGHLQ